MTCDSCGSSYVLGHPVAHSKSPAMYNALYRWLDLPWRYGLVDAASEQEARAFLAARDYFYVNVTTPYKELAFAQATQRAPSAAAACGANLLVKCDDNLVAHNTDGLGCVAYLERVGCALHGTRVAVCGTGPTARAILHACAAAGVGELALVGRDGVRARAVLQRCLEYGQKQARETVFTAGSYAEGTRFLSEADVVVDATPLGMRAGDPAPFDTSLLHAGQLVFDTVYGHGETALCAAARRAGCTVLTGEGMLVGQAVATAQLACAAAGISLDASPDDLFAFMAQAANFSC